MGRTGVELDGIFTPGVFPNSRSYGIGSHKSRRAHRGPSHVRGLDAALSFRLLLSLRQRSPAAATYAVKPCSCNCIRHIFAFLIPPSSARAFSPLESFSDSVLLIFARLNNAILRDQGRIRFEIRVSARDR